MRKKQSALLYFIGLSVCLANCSSPFTVLEPSSSIQEAKSTDGVALSVHPFAPDVFHEGVLEHTTPVFVHVTNGSAGVIRATPIAFLLQTSDGRTLRPIYSPSFQASPQPLQELPKPETPRDNSPPTNVSPTSPPNNSSPTPPSATTQRVDDGEPTSIKLVADVETSGVVLARAPGFHGGGIRPAPPFRSYGGYRGPSGYYSHPYSYPRSYGYSSYYGPRYYGGYRGGYGRYWSYYNPYYGVSSGWPYGYFGVYAPWYSGYGWPYNDYVAYEQGLTVSDEESIEETLERKGLPSINLAAGKQASGFIYFPRLDLEAGTKVMLIWNVQDEKGESLGELKVPLIVQEAGE